MKKVITNFDEFKNIESGSLQEELLRLRKLREWCDTATQKHYVDCKHSRSNAQAVKKWCDTFLKGKGLAYVSVVSQSKLYKNDSEIVYAKEIII
jgi:hypothetical protein